MCTENTHYNIAESHMTSVWQNGTLVSTLQKVSVFSATLQIISVFSATIKVGKYATGKKVALNTLILSNYLA